MTLIVYADFNCPECYLASRRVDTLAGGVKLDWRAVEHQPDLAVSGCALGEAGQSLTERFAVLSKMLLPGEQLPWSMPSRLPKTEAAVTALAEATAAGVATDVRRLLFELYWRDGADIGNPNVLRVPLAGAILRGTSTTSALHESGYCVAPDRGPVSTAGWRLLRDWRGAYRKLGSPQMPVVLIEGQMRTDLEAVRRLGDEIVCAGMPLPGPASNPRRYPKLGVRPGVSWVSQIGGPWLTAYRPANA